LVPLPKERETPATVFKKPKSFERSNAAIHLSLFPRERD
jgi:hypothetical protein